MKINIGHESQLHVRTNPITIIDKKGMVEVHQSLKEVFVHGGDVTIEVSTEDGQNKIDDFVDDAEIFLDENGASIAINYKNGTKCRINLDLAVSRILAQKAIDRVTKVNKKDPDDLFGITFSKALDKIK